MFRMLPVQRFPALFMLLFLALGAGCVSEGVPTADEIQRGYKGRVYLPPIEKPDFTLTDTEGEPFDFRAETDGKLTYLFVGYTYCPDICPIHMANIAEVFRKHPREADQVRVVFITADPERDTPERLRDWLNAFDRRFIGLHGTPDEVHAVEAALGLPPSVLPDDREGMYTVGHAAQVIAFSPHGPGHIAYPFGTRQADYAEDFPRLLTDRWGQ